VLPDAESVGIHAASRFALLLAGLTSGRGRLSVALPGGRTPIPFYHALVALDRTRPLGWRSVLFCFGDERCVPPEHEDSNFGLAKRELLSQLSAPPSRVLRMEAEREDLDDAAEDYEQALLREIPRTWEGRPFLDLIILGIGTDGHTASLFPNTEALSERRLLVVPNEVPQHGTMRMTLTYPVLDAAREAWFLVTGASKADILRELLYGPEKYPAAFVRPSGGMPLWIVDEAAAASL